MPEILKRESAKRDVIAQWVWYAENASVELADRFLEAVEATAVLLAHQPTSGRLHSVTRQELRGIRRFPVTDGFEKHLLFYLPRPSGIELVRVIHGHRDLAAALGGMDEEGHG
jgi:toxin ParE1/3/4